MAHGLNSVLKRGSAVGCKSEGKTGIGSRRIFAPHFKLQVLDSYRNDADCKGNQRATARKYGIHRRQIQKWLQVENNLRNSVASKSEEGPAEAVRQLQHRQRDDHGDRDGIKIEQIECVPEERVPAVNSPTSAPLDFTTHSRSPVIIKTEPTDMIIDSTAPIDLSLKKPTLTPSPATSLPVYLPDSGGGMSPPSLLIHQPHPDVWDLSMSTLNNNNCFKRKYSEMSSSSSSSSISPSSNSSSTKPVKLFKPYLDDEDDEDKKSDFYLPPCCNSAFLVNSDYCYNNNNCEINANYATFHELQTNSYYYYHPHQSYQAATEYELSPYHHYDDCCSINSVPLKQRHSYSLDFKLKAIECYYQDSICKGNQRAVATKYNIHRRQVQKWLKQADELKQKNETIKQTQMVR